MSLAFWVEAGDFIQTGDTVILVRGDASALFSKSAHRTAKRRFLGNRFGSCRQSGPPIRRGRRTTSSMAPPHLRDQLDRLAAQEGPSAREMYAQSRERDLQEQGAAKTATRAAATMPRRHAI